MPESDFTYPQCPTRDLPEDMLPVFEAVYDLHRLELGGRIRVRVSQVIWEGEFHALEAILDGMSVMVGHLKPYTITDRSWYDVERTLRQAVYAKGWNLSNFGNQESEQVVVATPTTRYLATHPRLVAAALVIAYRDALKGERHAE